MSFNYQNLTKKYQSEAPFNKAVNLFRKMIEEFGFTPSEIREALFLAQYQYEMNHVEQIIRTQEDWQRIAEARELMKNLKLASFPDLEKDLFK